MRNGKPLFGFVSFHCVVISPFLCTIIAAVVVVIVAYNTVQAVAVSVDGECEKTNPVSIPEIFYLICKSTRIQIFYLCWGCGTNFGDMTQLTTVQSDPGCPAYNTNNNNNNKIACRTLADTHAATLSYNYLSTVIHPKRPDCHSNNSR